MRVVCFSAMLLILGTLLYEGYVVFLLWLPSHYTSFAIACILGYALWAILSLRLASFFWRCVCQEF